MRMKESLEENMKGVSKKQTATKLIHTVKQRVIASMHVVTSMSGRLFLRKLLCALCTVFLTDT